jgi:uncharacterized protein YcaQ
MRFEGKDVLNPVGKNFGRRNLSRHARVIEVTVGVDEPWHQHHLTYIKQRFARGQLAIAPPTEPFDPAIFDRHRAVIDRPGNQRQQTTRPNDHQSL